MLEWAWSRWEINRNVHSGDGFVLKRRPWRTASNNTGPMEQTANAQHFKRYELLIEYKNLKNAGHCPSGVYIIPAFDNLNGLIHTDLMTITLCAPFRMAWSFIRAGWLLQERHLQVSNSNSTWIPRESSNRSLHLPSLPPTREQFGLPHSPPPFFRMEASQRLMSRFHSILDYICHLLHYLKNSFKDRVLGNLLEHLSPNKEAFHMCVTFEVQLVYFMIQGTPMIVSHSPNSRRNVPRSREQSRSSSHLVMIRPSSASPTWPTRNLRTSKNKYFNTTMYHASPVRRTPISQAKPPDRSNKIFNKLTWAHPFPTPVATMTNNIWASARAMWFIDSRQNDRLWKDRNSWWVWCCWQGCLSPWLWWIGTGTRLGSWV